MTIQRTHEQLAADLRSQLETVAKLLPVADFPLIVSASHIRAIQRLAARTFASQLWLCDDVEDISRQIAVNAEGARLFYPVAAFIVELLCTQRDLARFNFSEWGRYSLLADAVSIYLKELEKNSPSS
jgi:hypothetical protein